MEGQMKKGVLELCLLLLIAREETYGYDLLGRMTARFPELQESTVYAVLRRLAAEGWAETYTGGVSGGPARRYYRITAAGRQRLEALQAQWAQLAAAVAAFSAPEAPAAPPPAE